ncbi:MAG: hypothetical protein RLZZ245_2485, partial [Verrucomicrobiota bacterium]
MPFWQIKNQQSEFINRQSDRSGSRNWRGRRGFQLLIEGAVVVDVNDAPGAGDAAAAGGVEVGALAEVEVDVVENGDGEALGGGVEGGEFALLGVGGEFGGLGGGAFLFGVGEDGGDIGGGGAGHGE